MSGIAKKNVTNIDQLQQYLCEQSNGSDRLFHYTTYESLLQILKNKSLRLTRLDLLNDKAESKLGQMNGRTQYYVISFTIDKEYVSMWAMYGKPSGIKLRIDFDRVDFINAVNRNFYYDDELKDRIKINSDLKQKRPIPFANYDAIFSDVVYYGKETGELFHNTNPFLNFKSDEADVSKMTGFLKYSAWEFEKERRLRVAVNEISNDLTINKSPNYIYAGIDDVLISDLHITYNPWMTPLMKEEIKKSIDEIAGRSIECSDSINDGEITEL